MIGYLIEGRKKWLWHTKTGRREEIGEKKIQFGSILVRAAQRSRARLWPSTWCS